MKNQLVERMLYIVLGLVFAATGTLTYFAIQATDRLNDQQETLKQQVQNQKETLKGVKELVANQGKTTEEINKSLSCILTFFSNPNRAQLYISDFTTCTVTDTGTGQTQTLTITQAVNPVVSPATPNVQPSSPSAQPSTPGKSKKNKVNSATPKNGLRTFPLISDILNLIGL